MSSTLTLRRLALAASRPTRTFHSSARAFIKVGDKLPNLDVLVENSPGNKVNLSEEIKGKALLIGVPAAFSMFLHCLMNLILDIYCHVFGWKLANEILRSIVLKLAYSGLHQPQELEVSWRRLRYCCQRSIRVRRFRFQGNKCISDVINHRTKAWADQLDPTGSSGVGLLSSYSYY
jgi:hypothetical protein